MEEKPFKERRVFPRFPISLPLECLGGKIKAKTINISAQGLGIITEESLSQAGTIDINLSVPDNNEKISLEGEVVWFQPTSDGKYRNGIKLNAPVLKPISLILRILQKQKNLN